MLTNVGVPPSRRPRGRHSHCPTEGGAAVGAGLQVLLAPALALHPGTFTGPTVSPTCSPSFRWGPPIFVVSGPPCPPLHTHMKALHTHLHPHGPLHTLMLLCSQSSAPAPHPPLSSADPAHSAFCFTFFTLSSSHSPRSSQSLWSVGDFSISSHVCVWPHVVMVRVVPTLYLMNTH